MHKPSNADEKWLLQRLQQGDEAAFRQIYDLYKRRLAGNLLRMLKSDELVDEVLQDLFLKLWENRDGIDSEKPIRAYLFRIAENKVYDLFRMAARDRKMREHFRLANTEAYTHIEENILNREQAVLLEQAISQLPPQRQKIFRLCKLEGLSYEEVGKQLHISTSTINDHIIKANRFLKEYLASHGGIALSFLAVAIVQGIR